ASLVHLGRDRGSAVGAPSSPGRGSPRTAPRHRLLPGRQRAAEDARRGRREDAARCWSGGERPRRPPLLPPPPRPPPPPPAPLGPAAIYRRHFLLTLKRKALAKLRAHPSSGLDAQAVRAARRLRAFDDAFTAPSNGYRDAEDYYARAASGPVLGAIRRPVLCI